MRTADVLTWLLTLSYMGLIFFFSSMPNTPDVVPRDAYATYALHVVEYAVLGFLLSVSLKVKGKQVFLAIIVASLYGLSDEFHQSFVPNRIFSLYDVAADFFGACIGALFRR